jgi:hypothetical protein
MASLPAVIALGRALPPLKDVSTGQLSGKVEISLIKESLRITHLSNIDHYQAIYLPILLIAKPVHLSYHYFILFPQYFGYTRQNIAR